MVKKVLELFYFNNPNTFIWVYSIYLYENMTAMETKIVKLIRYAWMIVQ